MGFEGLYLALLVPITVDFVILAGNGVVMGSPLGLERVPQSLSGGFVGLHVCCLPRFAIRIPAWRLPVSGHVACQVTAGHVASGANGDQVSDREVHWFGGSGRGRKRIRLNRKTPAHLVGLQIQCRPRVWKRLCRVELLLVSFPDCKRRRFDQGHEGLVPVQNRTGVG